MSGAGFERGRREGKGGITRERERRGLEDEAFGSEEGGERGRSV